MSEFEAGQRVMWRRVVSNWGHEDVIPGVVTRVGKRVTIRVEPGRGRNGLLFHVTPERLTKLEERDGD